MIHLKKISLCLIIFACFSTTIFASQPDQLNYIQLLEQEVKRLNLQVTNLKNSLSATQALACALTFSNGNMTGQIKSHNSEAGVLKIKRDRLQKLLDENFNQGL